MQPKKEHYRRKLPHFQQPGQWYSVTFTLAGAMPKGAMDKYSVQVELARNRLEQLKAGLSGESDFPDSSTWKVEVPGVRLSSGVGLSKSDKRELGIPNSNFSDLGKSESWESDFPKSDNREPEFPNSDKKEPAPKFRDPNSDKKLAQAKTDYQIALRKYRLAFDKILNHSELPGVSLIMENNRKVIEEALLFWEGKRLNSHAWCIMSNHVHWILTVFEKEVGIGLSKSNICDLGKSQSRELEFPNSNIEGSVYLQDILHSVKLYTSRRINKNENRAGQLWEHESFDTTIRNNRHFNSVFNYVINNPVSAGLVTRWELWPGTRTF